MRKKTIVLLNNQKGVTLIEVIATFAILAFASVGIYLGVLYAESQVRWNYHQRVATLLASGEMEWQFYYYDRGDKEFDRFVTREVMINDFGGTVRDPIRGQMTMELITPPPVSLFGRPITYRTLKIIVTWQEPLLGQRSVIVQEDFF